MLDYIRHGSKCKIMAGAVPFWITNNKRASYILKAVLAAPPWVKRADFAALETERDRLTAETGIPHELDHIVPLSHPNVSGLTVPWNLRVIPRKCNGSRGNRWQPHQMEMFEGALWS